MYRGIKAGSEKMKRLKRGELNSASLVFLII